GPMVNSPYRTAEVMPALRSIVTDTTLGPDVLADPSRLANILEDLLPGAHREIQVLVAAAYSSVAQTLRTQVNEGMIAALAVRLTIARFAGESAFSQDVCDWAVRQFAHALGLDPLDGDERLQEPATVESPASPTELNTPAPVIIGHEPPT